MVSAKVSQLACLGLLLLGVPALSLGAGLSAAGQEREQSLEAAWSEELQAPPDASTKVVTYKSPIKRVVSLLEKMKSELEAEAANEAEMYDQQVCWCQTGEKEKTKAIADADAKDKDLQSEIEGRAARFGELASEIENLKGQIADDTQALKQATGLREGEAGEFREEEKELVQNINNLRNAIAILSKHHGGSSLLQLDAPLLASVRAVLRDVALKYELLLGDAPRAGEDIARAGALQARVALVATGSRTARLGKKERASDAQMQAVLQALDTRGAGGMAALPLEFAERHLEKAAATVESAFLQAGKGGQPAGAGESYTPQSGVIFGILNQLKEEFEAKLSTYQADEVKGKEDYVAVAKAKEQQLVVGKEKLDEMETEHAENQKALSDAKEDLELTREQRTADVEYLRNLKLTCQNLDKEWELRSKTRSQEILAVSEALTILTEDDNRDLLRKTVTLLQTSDGTSLRARRTHAAAALRRAAQAPAFDADDLLADWHGRHGSSAHTAEGTGPRARLATLAVTVQLDSFTKVKEAMDKMVAELKKQQTEEVEFKAYCDKEFNENEKTTYEKTEEKEDQEMKIEKLATHIKTLSAEIEAAKQQTADTEVEIKKASENREKENAAFQTLVADQRATQEILKKALARLKVFYKAAPAKEEALVQQTPPVQFNKLKSNAGASPVMGLIEQIIEDSVALEADAVSGETASQANYEAFVKDSNALIAELAEAISEKTKAIAAAKVETEQTEGDLQNTEAELESLAAYKADLHGQCDFVVKNFSIRQQSRLQEIEAIQAAKGILAGSSQ